ncbi:MULTISPECIES: LPXTG cell wall anchor domain-containing protein [Limosilactobacillus]|uniref:LPXTG cell wall anchor domain-containing protein n=1 Tax=Limosilactobacillus TaxID=2742598 RepID=UPI00242E472F|nr:MULTISPECIES: LPXTG cell wall anchor domain-containing protein [Limosilactobacillus]MCI6852768.1 LPXTG cell wall anchor domain-containing protein [Limosilactobacillus vaginalis]MDY4864648.1 LPXTG cell wall anchor domain-containing protein [Limosilactobacillus sp.]
MKNLKKLAISGTTLVAAMTMGVATISSTAHADSYQNLENYWKTVYPDSKVDFVTAAKQGNGDAWRLTTQLDGYKANNNVQQSNSQSVTNNNSQVQAQNSAATTASSSTTANTQQPTYVATKSNSGMKTLPQTGNNNGEAVAATGLGLTSLASMFGFGLLKRRFN